MRRGLKLLVVLIFAIASAVAYGQPYEGPIIDVHMHANSDALGKYRPRGPEWPETLLEATIQEMDKNNIRVGVISGDNTKVQQWVQTHPDRFIPSYNLMKPADFNPEAWRVFTSPINEQWIPWKGLGELSLPYVGRPIDDPLLRPLLVACEKAGLPVFYHTGIGWPMVTNPNSKQLPGLKYDYKLEAANPLLLEAVAKEHPDLKIVICHMGWPFEQYAMALAKMHRNVYIDCSCLPWSLDEAHFHRILRETVGAAGSHKVAFGSDQMHWPWFISKSVQVVKQCGLSHKDQENIFWNTPRKILGIADQQKRSAVE